MQTLIVDLFHPYPDQIGSDNAEHDIIGTSESGVNLCVHFGNKYRFYYCQDVHQELSALDWHANDPLSNSIQLEMRDVDGAPPKLTSVHDDIRLIINGQGYISKIPQEDTIGGLNTDEFMQAIDEIFESLHIDGPNRRLVELVISSCSMARSNVFVGELSKKFLNHPGAIKVVLFKEMISFSSGEYISFFENGKVVSQPLTHLTDETSLTFNLGINPKKRNNNLMMPGFSRYREDLPITINKKIEPDTKKIKVPLTNAGI